MVFLRVVSEETDVSTAFATEFVRSTGQEVSSSNLYTRPVPVRTRYNLQGMVSNAALRRRSFYY